MKLVQSNLPDSDKIFERLDKARSPSDESPVKCSAGETLSRLHMSGLLEA